MNVADGPGVSAGGPQKPKSTTTTTAKKTPKVAAPAAVPVSGGGAEPPDLVRFTPAAAAQQQTAELDRLETEVADQAAVVARISRSHADTVAGARVMSVVMAHMADKVMTPVTRLTLALTHADQQNHCTV